MQQFKMSALKSRTAFVVGVALCVTPIFTSAQSNDGSRMFSEMQSMRQEIAELRDMIERQQFEMRKLKRAQQENANPATTPGYGAVSPSYNDQGSVSPTVASSPQIVAAQQPYGAPNVAPSEQAVSTAVGNAYPVSNTGSVTAPVGASNASAPQSTADESFYQPYPSDAPASRAVSTQQGVPVSSAVITAPPVQDTGYPPVVERSVGSAPISTQYPGTRDPSQNDQYSVRQIQQAVPASAIEAANRAPNQGVNQAANQAPLVITDRQAGSVAAEPMGTGVIAVPTTVVGVPTPRAQATVQNQTNSNAYPAAVTQTQPQAAVAAAVMSETDYYQQGFNLLKQSKHDDAVGVFEQQIAAYPNGDYADDAYYWIAESMYVNRNLAVSKKNFKAIIDNFKQSTRLPDAMLKTAYIEQEQGNQIEARILLQEIVQFHPRSNAAISAKNRLAEMVN